MQNELIVVAGGFIVLYIAVFIKILNKMGLPKWWAALGLIPIVNIAVLLKLAYARWPNYPDR